MDAILPIPSAHSYPFLANAQALLKAVVNYSCWSHIRIINTSTQGWRPQICFRHLCTSDWVCVVEWEYPGIWPQALVMLQ